MTNVPEGDLSKWDSGAPAWQREGRYSLIDFRCPNGHLSQLRGYNVAAGGEIDKKVCCPKDGCGFNDEVKLIGWKE